MIRRHPIRSREDRRTDNAGSWPQLRRKPAGHAKADYPGAIAKQLMGICDRCCKRGRQIAAVATTNNMDSRTRSDAGLKCQSNDDDQEPPIVRFCGSGSYNGSRATSKILPLRRRLTYILFEWTRLSCIRIYESSARAVSVRLSDLKLTMNQRAQGARPSMSYRRPLRAVPANLSRSIRNSLARVNPIDGSSRTIPPRTHQRPFETACDETALGAGTR